MSAAYKREPTLVTDPFLASRRLFDDLVAQASSAQALEGKEHVRIRFVGT